MGEAKAREEDVRKNLTKTQGEVLAEVACLWAEGVPASIKAVAERVGRATSSVRDSLVTLEGHGVVEQVERVWVPAGYRPGLIKVERAEVVGDGHV